MQCSIPNFHLNTLAERECDKDGVTDKMQQGKGTKCERRTRRATLVRKRQMNTGGYQCQAEEDG